MVLRLYEGVFEGVREGVLSPETSLIMSAPASTAALATSAFLVSTEMIT